MTINKKPELLAPAGDLEKLEAAVLYGADAVYIGTNRFSLRAKARNFDPVEMRKGIELAHKHGVKVYAAVNIYAGDEDLQALATEKYFETLLDAGVDACIVSDPGVFSLAQKTAPEMELHISTQASTTNAGAAQFWRKSGAKRIIAARELSLKQLAQMRRDMPPDMALEVFVHGAMCMSYSGRCLLSAYLAGRNANKGECAQPCRWEFGIIEPKNPNLVMPIMEDEHGSYILNAKDLCMIEHIPELINAGIDSFKIEGRMKTSYYVASIVKAYREAIDYYWEYGSYPKEKAAYLKHCAEMVSHRSYDTGFFFPDAEPAGQIYNSSAYIRGSEYLALVLDYDKSTCYAKLSQRNKFILNSEVEALTKKGENKRFIITDMRDENFEPITSAPHPQQTLYIKTPVELANFDMIRAIH